MNHSTWARSRQVIELKARVGCAEIVRAWRVFVIHIAGYTPKPRFRSRLLWWPDLVIIPEERCFLRRRHIPPRVAYSHESFFSFSFFLFEYLRIYCCIWLAQYHKQRLTLVNLLRLSCLSNAAVQPTAGFALWPVIRPSSGLNDDGDQPIKRRDDGRELRPDQWRHGPAEPGPGERAVRKLGNRRVRNGEAVPFTLRLRPDPQLRPG